MILQNTSVDMYQRTDSDQPPVERDGFSDRSIYVPWQFCTVCHAKTMNHSLIFMLDEITINSKQLAFFIHLANWYRVWRVLSDRILIKSLKNCKIYVTVTGRVTSILTLFLHYWYFPCFSSFALLDQQWYSGFVLVIVIFFWLSPRLYNFDIPLCFQKQVKELRMSTTTSHLLLH